MFEFLAALPNRSLVESNCPLCAFIIVIVAALYRLFVPEKLSGAPLIAVLPDCVRVLGTCLTEVIKLSSTILEVIRYYCVFFLTEGY